MPATQFRSLLQSAAIVTALSLAGPLVVPSQVLAKEFTWAFQGEVQTLDPHAITEYQTIGFISNMYEPLVRRNENLVLEPGLAVSWERTSPTVWRMNLRQGVVFHDGTPFTAEDVLFSFARSRGKTSGVTSKIHSISEIRKIDDHTIDIVTSVPNPIMIEEMSDWFIASKRWMEANDAAEVADVSSGAENFATRNALGTGAFKLVSRETDVRTVLEPHEGWWDERTSNVTRATFRPISNAATRMAALLSGELDMAYPVPTQDIARVESSDGTYVERGEEARVLFLGFDQHRDELLYGSVKDKNPFKDKRVRQAFNQAIDVDAIIDRIMDGSGVRRATVLSSQMRGFSEELDQPGSTFDPAAARTLLAEAGYPDGFTVTLDCPNDRYPNDENICVATAGLLGRVGIKVDLAAVPKTQYFGKALARDTSFFMLGWGAPTLDGHSPLFEVFSSPSPEGHGRWNFGAYSNPRVDELTTLITREVDEEARAKLMNEAFELIKEDYAIIPLFQTTLAWGIRDGVELKQRADEKFELRWVNVK